MRSSPIDASKIASTRRPSDSLSFMKGSAFAPQQQQQTGGGGGGGMDETPGAQPRPRDCVHFVHKGACKFGPNCRYNHPVQVLQASPYSFLAFEFPERIGQPDCQFYIKTGTCKFGAQCKYNHPRLAAGSARGPPPLNYLGLPIRPGEKECTYYLRTGSCKFGAACRFHHPDLAGTRAALFPSFSHNAPLAPAPWRHLYIPGSGLPGSSSYMPMYSSSPQSVLFNGGWNMYQGLSSPMSNGNHGGFYNGGAQSQVTGMRAPYNSSLNCSPRHDQQVCQFYLQTGHCKYGASCKYSHSRSMVVPMVAATLSPMGLPLRPGQPHCTFYLKNGICKFGPVCRYDHPMQEPSISTPSSPSQETIKVEEESIHPTTNDDGNHGSGEREDPVQVCDTKTEDIRD